MMIGAGTESTDPDAPPFPDFADWLQLRFPEMVWDKPHHMAIIDALEMVTAGETDRLMLFVPPRHGKTELVTIRYAAWRMERDGTLPVVLGAYNQDLANKFSRAIRRIVRERVPLSIERTAVNEWETAAGGGLRAVGVGSGITGHGGGMLLIDDPVKGREEADSPAYRERLWGWYVDDFYTRREPGAPVILIQTRWHQDDLAGRILASDDGPNWTVIHIPALAMEDDPLGRPEGAALWPERVPAEEILKYRSFNLRGFWALYQGMPQPEGGAVFMREWWDGVNRYDPTDTATQNRVVARAQFWDTAQETHDQAAFTSCVTVDVMSGNVVHVRDVYRARLSVPELQPAIERQAERWNRDLKLKRVRIEKASTGGGVLQNIMASSPEWLQRITRGVSPKSSKVDRARAVTIYCANNLVQFPWPDESVPWLHDFEEELYGFPQSQFADQVDAFVLGLTNLQADLRLALRRQGYNPPDDPAANAAG